MARRPRPVKEDTKQFIPVKFKALTKGQENYIKAIETSAVTICISPAGTGKTYVAVATAVEMLQRGRIDKIVITRPVVECGESLGFLPGELQEKIHPYLLPIYDVLKEFLSAKEIEELEKDERIEICPLAYMRGRSLKNCVVILDEAQNASYVQLKMILTRIGERCRMVINGDHTQSDLHTSHVALLDVVDKLKDMDEISIVRLKCEDIVRSGIISKIIERLQ